MSTSSSRNELERSYLNLISNIVEEEESEKKSLNAEHQEEEGKTLIKNYLEEKEEVLLDKLNEAEDLSNQISKLLAEQEAQLNRISEREELKKSNSANDLLKTQSAIKNETINKNNTELKKPSNRFYESEDDEKFLKKWEKETNKVKN